MTLISELPPGILREPGSGTREVFEAAVLHHVERLQVRMELSQHEAIKQAVKAGLGLGCLSHRSVEGKLERGELVFAWRVVKAHQDFFIGVAFQSVIGALCGRRPRFF